MLPDFSWVSSISSSSNLVGTGQVEDRGNGKHTPITCEGYNAMETTHPETGEGCSSVVDSLADHIKHCGFVPQNNEKTAYPGCQ